MDTPDPSIESEARLREVGFPVFELRPQPSLTRAPITGFTESSGPAGRDELTVAFTYTLWKYPDDHSDPRNEVELDERTRRAIEEEPPWGRPAWLVEQAQIFRYPMLSEAVRTAWHASPDPERASLPQQLIDHTNHVLRNSFREELGLPAGPSTSTDWKVKAVAVTLREVGRRAGVSHNAPYKHFADKEDLLAALAARELRHLQSQLQEDLDAGGVPGEALARSAVTQTVRAVEFPERYRLIYGRWNSSEGLDRVALESSELMTSTVRDAQRAGSITAGDPERIAALIRAASRRAAELESAGHLAADGKRKASAVDLVQDLLGLLAPDAR